MPQSRPEENVQKVLPTEGMHILKFVAADGRSVELEPHKASRFEVAPMDFVQLVRAAETRTPSLDVVIKNGSASTADTGLDLEGPLTATLTWANNGPVVAYGLVEGGWLPLPWAHRRTAWVDRNVVINLEKFKDDVEREFAPGDRAWLTKWLGLDVDEVSPILFALEGATRRPPTDFEMRAELGRADKVLRKTLPGAKVQKVNCDQRRALHRMNLEHAEYRGREMRVLVRAAPLVMNNVKAGQRRALEAEVLAIAQQEGVRVGLTVLALLSCVYDANPGLSGHLSARPGRAVVKPREGYDLGDAYNTVSDLYFIELLVNAHKLFPAMEQVLYTGDIGIASFWAALQPLTTTIAHLPNGKVRPTVNFNIGSSLFPALSSDELVDLAQRLKR